MGGHALLLSWIGEAYLVSGRTADATQYAIRALGLSEQSNERGNQAYARRLLAEISCCREPIELEEGEEQYRPLLAGCTGARASASKPTSTSTLPRPSTARWTCGSGWRRRRRR